MELMLFSYIADFVVGDPRWFPHPVRLIGKLISYFERILNDNNGKATQRFYGTLTAIGIVAMSGMCAYAAYCSGRKIASCCWQDYVGIPCLYNAFR